MIVNGPPIGCATPNGDFTLREYMVLKIARSKTELLLAKFYLIPDLPVKLLASIQLLQAGGYKFVDEIPPLMRNVKDLPEDYLFED